MSMLLPVAVVLLALVGDALLGDPSNRFHPVAWIGTAISAARRATPRHGKSLRFVYGLLLVSVGIVAMASTGWLFENALRRCPLAIAMVGQAILLKCTFSVRSLASAANGVAAALRRDDITSARHQVAYHLVSRDVSALDETQLSAATIESVAENTSDSVIAPLFYFAIAGLPGVFIYRFVNTCDAMLGYHSEELEWYGKPAARFDDVLNFVPARLTAVTILFCGFVTSRPWSAVVVWWRDHGKTASPNAGHPMSAAAGVLGVALEKKGHYLLGGEQPRPTVAAIEQAVKLLWATTVVYVLLLSTVLVVRAIR